MRWHNYEQKQTTSKLAILHAHNMQQFKMAAVYGSPAVLLLGDLHNQWSCVIRVPDAH